MSFEIDQETFADLEVFTERQGGKSLFAVFNTTRTEGGKRALKDMMFQPVSDAGVLRNRRDAIQYFHESTRDLEISYNQLGMIEHYLLFNKTPLRDNFLDAIWGHWANKINDTNDYYVITSGITLLIKLFRTITAFFQESNPEIPVFLVEKFRSVSAVLDTRLLQDLISGKKQLNCFALNKLDRFFRVQKKTQVRDFLEFVFELDVYEAVAGKLNYSGWSLPVVEPAGSGEVLIQGLRHPTLQGAIENDTEIKAGTSVIFLTGPNMGGKSSYLKSVGLAVYLAHLGFPVPATQMRTPLFRGLITTINLPDNIHQGLSHYYSEVKRVKKTVMKLSEHDSMFVIFDELFRGTNFQDAYDASLSIISRLSKMRRSKFLISTHITELAGELDREPRIAFKYFESFFLEGKPQFTYKMKDGVSEERLGMYIIKEEGILDMLDEMVQQN